MVLHVTPPIMAAIQSLGFLLYNLVLLCGCLGSEDQGKSLANMEISNKNFYMTFPADARISFDVEWGTVRFLQASNLTQALEQKDEFRSFQAANRFKDIVLMFFDAYRVPFKLTNPMEELVVHSVQADDLGFTQVRLKQTFANIPLWGAEILVQLDRFKHINLVHGRYYPSPHGVNLLPKLSAEVAWKHVASHLSLPDSSCPACPTKLVIFITTEKSRLAYSIRAMVSLVEGWELIVDAETGAILQKVPTVYNQ